VGKRDAPDGPLWAPLPAAIGALACLFSSVPIGKFDSAVGIGVVGRVLIRLEGRLVPPGQRFRATFLNSVNLPFTVSLIFVFISK
jgi:hypothetical protein